MQLNIEYSFGASFRREIDNENLIVVFHHPYTILLAGPDNSKTHKNAHTAFPYCKKRNKKGTAIK